MNASRPSSEARRVRLPALPFWARVMSAFRARLAATALGIAPDQVLRPGGESTRAAVDAVVAARPEQGRNSSEAIAQRRGSRGG